MVGIGNQVMSLFGQAMGRCSCNLTADMNLTEAGANYAVKEQVARNLEAIFNVKISNADLSSWQTIQDARARHTM